MLFSRWPVTSQARSAKASGFDPRESWIRVNELMRRTWTEKEETSKTYAKKHCPALMFPGASAGRFGRAKRNFFLGSRIPATYLGRLEA